MDVIPNTGSDRGTGYALLLREAHPAPFNPRRVDRPVTGASTKEWRSGKCLKIRTPSCHFEILETKSPCIPLWTGDMQWVGRRDEGGFDLRRVNRGDRPGAPSPGEQAPQSHTCSTQHAASAAFPFFFPSFSLSHCSLSTPSRHRPLHLHQFIVSP